MPDLTQLLGGDTAYAGFTGSYGGQTSIQTITNFSFVSLASLAMQLSHETNAVLSWPGDIRGYGPQQNSDLSATNWLDVTNADNVTNGQHRVVVPLVQSNLFYRLMLLQCPPSL